MSNLKEKLFVLLCIAFISVSATAANASVIHTAASWLLTQQESNGGFPWTPGGPVTSNTQGPTARGLLKASQLTSNSTYLNAAQKTGDYLVPNYPRLYTDGDPRIATHDPLFLEELSTTTADSTYSDFVQTYFWDKLSSGTYGETNNLDAAGFGAAVVNGRASQGIVELSPWDLSATAIGAYNAGEMAIGDALMDSILDGLEATTAGDTYDVIGLAGAVWASGVTGVDLDPTTGAYAASDSTADLAAELASHQLGGGGWIWNSTADPNDPTNQDTQATAYALLALNAFDRNLYNNQLWEGIDYLVDIQDPSGQFIVWPGASANTAGSIEVHGEAMTAYATVVPEPSTMLLLGVGLVSLVGFGRKKLFK